MTSLLLPSDSVADHHGAHARRLGSGDRRVSARHPTPAGKSHRSTQARPCTVTGVVPASVGCLLQLPSLLYTAPSTSCDASRPCEVRFDGNLDRQSRHPRRGRWSLRLPDVPFRARCCSSSQHTTDPLPTIAHADAGPTMIAVASRFRSPGLAKRRPARCCPDSP